MKLREAEYKTCGECQHSSLVRDEEWACDFCRRVMPLNESHHRATIFWKGSGDRTKDYMFCSVPCFARWFAELPMAADLDFMSWPLFHMEDLWTLQQFFAGVPSAPLSPSRGRSSRSSAGRKVRRA